MRLRAADKPAIPAPTMSTDLVSGGNEGSDAQAPASPPPTTLVVAAKNSRRDIGDTLVSVSHLIGRGLRFGLPIIGRSC